jgi:hypothetical protein
MAETKPPGGITGGRIPSCFTYKPTAEFTPNDVVVRHCCQSLAMAAAESVERFGVVGQ